MALSPAMAEYAKRTDRTVRRWDGALTLPDDADDVRAASLIRGAMISAAKKAAAFTPRPFYCDDHSWSHAGMRGLTRARIAEEVEISRDKMAPSPEEWGILARVEAGDVFFDVPVAIDLDESAARNILAVMEGSEARFVDVERVGAAFPGERFRIFLHADNWGRLRELALDGILTLEEAMDFRRPVSWDLLRASLADLPPEPLPAFSEEEFYTRFARSSRYDETLMDSNREMVEAVASIVAEPLTPSWGEWHPAVVDLLNSIGEPQQIDGISVVLNFVVQEPATGLPEDADGDPIDAWEPVGYHNVIVCYGLHPLSANQILELVMRNPTAFYDLPPGDDRRHVLVGASAIQDTMLSALRVSVHGRTDAYERVAAVPLAA